MLLHENQSDKREFGKVSTIPFDFGNRIIRLRPSRIEMSCLAFERDPMFSSLPQHIKISAMIVYHAFLTCLLVLFVGFHYVMWRDYKSYAAIRGVLESVVELHENMHAVRDSMYQS